MKIYNTQVGPIMTNCYLLCDEEAGVCALIDPGDNADRVERMVTDSGCDLQMILLTHGHFDHCSAVRPLLALHPDVPVYIHRSDTVDPGVRNDLKFPRLEDRNQRYYAEGDVVTLGSIRLTVWETPGHSRGSVCLIGSYEDILHSLGRLGRLEGNYRVFPGHEGSTQLDLERLYNPYLRQAMSL